MLNTGITLISDVVGLRGKSGAFVFGSYSFLDKISTGIALFFISESAYFKNEEFIRWITVLIPGVSCLFAWILVMRGKAKDYNKGKEVKDKFVENIQVEDEKLKEVLREFAN